MTDAKQRPPIEELDRLHGEAADGEWYETMNGNTWAGILPLDTDAPENRPCVLAIHNSWPQVSAYIRELEESLKEARKAAVGDLWVSRSDRDGAYQECVVCGAKCGDEAVFLWHHNSCWANEYD